MLGSFWVWSEQSVAPMVFIDFTPFGGFNCHSHVENTQSGKLCLLYVLDEF